jgi:hypothetical protein
MKLLNIDANPKTVKGQKKGYMTAILYLAPYKLSGYQVCPMAEAAGCIGDCLNTAGRGGMAPLNAETVTVDGHVVRMNSVQFARIERTRFLFEDRQTFMCVLTTEIIAAQKKAAKNGLELVVRLNGTSDIRWENIKFGPLAATIFEHFPDIQFYDYTKIANRRINHIPNYHLTFSFSAVKKFQANFNKAMEFYGRAMNAAVVFKGNIPETFMGMDVVNGDETDLRFLDRKGVIVALKAKGKARKSDSGFAVAA